MGDAGKSLPPTELIYMTYGGNFCFECESKVLDVKFVDKETVQIVLDRTVLHAQGGGQPTDTGTIAPSNIKVSKVLLDRETGVAVHSARASSSPTKLPIRVGDSVQVTVDTERRRILSECHTAGHVVDSAMERAGLAMKPSKAYHFLDSPYVEYVGSISIDERDSILLKLQEAFNQLVDEDIDTKIEMFTKEDADSLCNRQAQNFDVDVFADRNDQIRVVTVANYPCPCGGTHVKSTGELKRNQWQITGLKSKKGVVRVKYGPAVVTTNGT